MEESTYIKTTAGQAGTSGSVSHVTLRKNEVIDILRMLEMLKNKLQPLLK